MSLIHVKSHNLDAYIYIYYIYIYIYILYIYIYVDIADKYVDIADRYVDIETKVVCGCDLSSVYMFNYALRTACIYSSTLSAIIIYCVCSLYMFNYALRATDSTCWSVLQLR